MKWYSADMKKNPELYDNFEHMNTFYIDFKKT